MNKCEIINNNIIIIIINNNNNNNINNNNQLSTINDIAARMRVDEENTSHSPGKATSDLPYRGCTHTISFRWGLDARSFGTYHVYDELSTGLGLVPLSCNFLLYMHVSRA